MADIAEYVYTASFHKYCWWAGRSCVTAFKYTSADLYMSARNVALDEI